MQAEVARRAVVRDLQNTYRMDVAVLLFAHAELRAVSDPVLPDSLPTTKQPELRAELEAALREGVRRVAAVPPDPPGAGVREIERHRGGVTLQAFGLDAEHQPGAAVQRLPAAQLERVLKRYAERKPEGKREAALVLVWRALTRYSYLGLRSNDSAAVPPEIYARFREFDAVEGFASLFNSTLPRYHGMFPDLEADFGCVGNFFALPPREAPALLLCNPPYANFLLNAFANKCLQLLEGGRTTILCVLPAFETSDREALNAGGGCAAQYPVDFATDVDTSLLKRSRFNRHCGLYCKESFRFVDPMRDEQAALTSVMLIVLSSLSRMYPTVATILDAFPQRTIPCSDGPRAVALYTDITVKTGQAGGRPGRASRGAAAPANNWAGGWAVAAAAAGLTAVLAAALN